MGSTSRRKFLKLCAASAPVLAAPELLSQQAAAGVQPAPAAQPAYRTSATLEKFLDKLPLPQRLQPLKEGKDKVQYQVRMMEFSQKLHSQLPPTRLWGYEGQYPGPTIEALRGQAVEVRWENRLPEQHLFPIDTHIHGAMAPSPAVRSVPHLHGSRTDSVSDGLPEKWFRSGESHVYTYPNDQPPATLWYHDHAVGITRLNVYAGLSGFYLLRDQAERAMNLPAGEYEIPLLLQDRTVDDKGQLAYLPTLEDGTVQPPGLWGPEFFGEMAVVNGAAYPYVEVEPCRYRFRVLNGANSRFFRIFLNLARKTTDVPELVDFQQIGTDGGFLAKPAQVTKLLMGSGERADVIVDFSRYAGKVVTLCNDAMAPYPGWAMLNAGHAPLSELMEFRVTRPLSDKAKAFSLPPTVEYARFDAKQAVTSRDFIIAEKLDENGKSLGVRINDKGYDDAVTEQPKLGTLEKWRFINTTDDAHPMHLHLVQFQILERQGFNVGAYNLGKLEMIGIRRPPAPNEDGWKDTAVVHPGEALTILVRFEGFTGRYVFHCHMLEHEDNDMMRPFEVVPA